MNWFDGAMVNLKNSFWEFFYELSNNIYNALVVLIQEMVKLISQLPLIKDFPEIYQIWKFIVFTSGACIGLIFVYLAAQSLSSMGTNIIRSVEMKIVFGRLLYMCVFVGMSLVFIDWLILFNNELSLAIISKFRVNETLQQMKSENITGNLIAAGLIIVQIVLIIKIMIGYWLRVGEILLMAVISPAIFTIWINPNWGGYLNEWNRRIVTLIFTGFIQAVILAIYALMIMRFYDHGTISSLCLAVAMLILMLNGIQFLQRFVARDNAIQIMGKTARNISSTSRRINRIRRKFAK